MRTNGLKITTKGWVLEDWTKNSRIVGWFDDYLVICYKDKSLWALTSEGLGTGRWVAVIVAFSPEEQRLIRQLAGWPT